MITLRVGNIFTDIDGVLTPTQWKGLEMTLAFRPQGYQFTPAFNTFIRNKEGKPIRRMWDGWKRQFWKNTKRAYFPTGLMSLAVDYLAKEKVEIRAQDCRTRPEPSFFAVLADSMEERDYQIKTVNDSCAKTRGIIQAATGAGKTAIAARIIQKLSVSPFVFFVTSIDLLTQARDSFEEFLRVNGSPLKVGQIGAGKCDIRDINVMTVQTAVRALGYAWDKKTKFDEDDEDDEEDITLAEQNREKIVQLMRTAKGYFCDECITGDAIVITRDGPERMNKLSDKIGKEVLSFSGTSVVWKRITGFYRKGVRKILNVTLTNGQSIRCTEEHPIYTRIGWKQTSQLKRGDEILYCASAAAESEFQLSGNTRVGFQSTYSDTKSDLDPSVSGRKSLTRRQTQRQDVNVAAENMLNCMPEHCKHSSREGAANSITDLFADTTKDQTNGVYVSPSRKKRQYSEHCSVIRGFLFLLKGAAIQGFTAIMDYFKPNGLSSNRIILRDCQQSIGNTKTAVSGNGPLRTEHAAILSCCESTVLSATNSENESQNPGWTRSAASDSPGGFATMDQGQKVQSHCTLKALLWKKLKSHLIGYPIIMGRPPSINREPTTTFTAAKNAETTLLHVSNNTFRSACSTKFVKVESVIPCGEEEVYDISVEGTHCFFANGLLVHNCQHWRAETCQLVAREMHSAYFVYGMSATPYRDEGDDMMIQACFGKKIAQITASDLIRGGWLIAPKIKIVHIKHTTPYKTWQTIYKDAVVENKKYNSIIANIATKYIENDRQVLILVHQINHGKDLASRIPDAIFLSGKSSKKKREDALERMRAKEISCIVSTTIFDEGIDVRSLDTVILAGQGKSRTRAMQRVGRALRTFTDKRTGRVKTTATIIDFRILCKYLEEHSEAREEMYETEPEFQIEHIYER